MADGIRRDWRRLPVVRINGVGYFMDGRLKQLRAVCNPDDWVDFEPDEIEPWAVLSERDE